MSELTPQQKLLGTSWGTLLGDEFKKDYMASLSGILKEERKSFIVYPSQQDVFNAYKMTPYKDVRVVIIGQDPYYKPDQANGLAFSVPENMKKTPPTLDNIFREVEDDLGEFRPYHSSDLSRWAKQGVFLLNVTLTVRQGRPASHMNIGWEKFTLKTVQYLNASVGPIVFMLWGNFARGYKHYIDDGHHLVLEAPHPSPRSADRGFFGCKHFSKANQFLQATYGEDAIINWVEPKDNHPNKPVNS